MSASITMLDIVNIKKCADLNTIQRTVIENVVTNIAKKVTENSLKRKKERFANIMY